MRPQWMMAGLAFVLLAVGLNAQDASPLKSDKDKTSYALGVAVGKSFQAQGIDSDPNLIAQGLKDALAGGKLLITDDEFRSLMTAFQQSVNQKQMAAKAALADSNKKAGESFLADNAKKDGVVTLPSGLQYKIITAGTGNKPTDADTVMCQYKGTLIDGTEFDSTKNAQSATIEVGRVIPGFKEALKLMPVGSKWQFFIPAGLAYGETGAGNVIGPNSALIFEIELVSIQGKQVMPGTPAPAK
jgi:UDP-GlcNAc:undecaprenyl-phosphate/decaprenyl-phosphate GlcNAc-1-phosphate transferase